jgi:three-Cys-motif partner protein
MPLSDKPSYVIGSDGLPVRISGLWAKRKHHFLRNYCGITTNAVGTKFPNGLVYLDVMSGPGRCLEEENEDEFNGSPFVALEFDFSRYVFMEADPSLFQALETRLHGHPKRDRVQLFNEDWVDVIGRRELKFDAKSLVVAFVDPTGIAAMPFSAIEELMRFPKIDLLITIQYRLGIHLNIPQFLKSRSEQTVLDRFLGHSQWRSWEQHDFGQFTRRAVDQFCAQIHNRGFKGAHHVSVPEQNPFYRFAYFSRHDLGTKFWKKVTATDEKGQRDLPF